MYAVGDYLVMLGDEPRQSAYRRAIDAVVRPGDHVVEIGAGFGYFAVLAALRGAARVDAVDVTSLVHLAGRLAASNGVADRVRVHHGDAASFDPGRRADVMVGDLRGASPLFRTAVQTWIAARDRVLRPGGTVIAAADRLFCAPCRAPKGLRNQHAGLQAPAVDLSSIATIASHSPFRCFVDAVDLIADGKSWGAIDYATVQSPNVNGEASWTLTNEGDMSGVAMWFESDVAPGIRLSTHPADTPGVYGHFFLPLREVVHVMRGDELHLQLRAMLVGDDYLWQWRTQVSRSGQTVLTIDQNSLAERVVDPLALKPLC